MKSLSTALKAHIQGEVTTIATLIEITRMDGNVYYFTDHDMPILVDGVTFLPYHTFKRTSVPTSLELEVDGLELTAILNDAQISRADVAGGLFNFAKVLVYLVNWSDPSMGKMILRKGWIGEITTNEDNTIQAEIRGLTQVLTYKIGDPYTPECRADLGDILCGVAIVPPDWAPRQNYTLGQVVRGKVSAALYFINLPFVNESFEEDVSGTVMLAPTGWTAYGDPHFRWSSDSSNGNMPPAKDGAQFLRSRWDGQNGTDGGLYQVLNLLTSGVTADQIDAGNLRISASVWFANQTPQGACRMRVSCYDASNNLIAGLWDSGFHTYANNTWVRNSKNDMVVPAGTRNIRVDLNAKKQKNHDTGACFDGVNIALNMPNGTFNNADQYGNVNFQCTVAGASGATSPAFSNLLGSTVTDGGVTWTAIHSFQDVDIVHIPAADNRSFKPNSLPQAAGWYDGGLLTWETGKNAGASQEVKTWDGTNITLFQRPFYPMAENDRYVIHPGCDKLRTTCSEKFGNILNFRGEPDVPGQDAYYSTPNAS